MNKPFKFKAFTVQQDQCAMKIGTDSVLLGAWTNLNFSPTSILDIGAGTGILALMLAQRVAATGLYVNTIDALEIDANAYEQCVDNFENSPWADALFCYHASLEEFAEEIDDTYDLIISNPPFYSENYKTPNQQRDSARFQDAMPFPQLLAAVAKLLSETGQFSVIVPHQEASHFLELATNFKLYPNYITQVKGHATAPVKRSLITLSKQATNIQETTLVIETERHQYTQDYINLTQAFYLNM
ncbi:tRNA1(Val) (adenine(37)-N6)-methyltransferase [Bizionia sediminis]|uniref:tRNA1(Val) (adenine(37)-N6)-methyltransferase n=1 Tax=Bizionia sediminis TaxID=1737064 RepID=A0ABW5KSD3_9FLAO